MKQAFLVLDSPERPGAHRVRIISELRTAIESWLPATRLSPLFIRDTSPRVEEEYEFPGEHDLVLLGPVSPAKASPFIGERDYWLTLGCYNVVVHCTSREDAERMVEWASEASINFERWKICDGRIVDVEYCQARAADTSWRTELGSLADAKVPPELEELLKEYSPLMASALSRSGQVIPEVIDDLLLVAAYVRGVLLREKGGSGVTPHEGLKLFTTLNAGLSRYSSQAYSGTSPVIETECHFWTHSLLGTGIANIALLRFCRFVGDVFERAAIAHRVEQYVSLPGPPSHLDQLQDSDKYLDADFLPTVEVTTEHLQTPDYRPVTCFSGRDGFKSTLMTVSAPLAVITACNTMRWTLLTLTHELSHNIVRAVLGKLYPFPTQLEEAKKILQAPRPANLLDALRRSVLLAAFGMQQQEDGSNRVSTNPAAMVEVLRRWQHEIEEIMVHVFDYLYFYGGDAEKYIRSIWLSWSVIPNIGSRVPEYVIRTLSAVMTAHLRRGSQTEELTRETVLRHLEALHGVGEGGEYIAHAIDQLSNANWEMIKRRLVVRRPLVQLVRTFLYSETVAQELRGDPFATGGAAARAHGGYPMKYLEFTESPVGNPLAFIDAYTGSGHASSEHSMWMVYMLAFNVRPRA